ncbi:MFS transporter [Gulosibacter molinativorax]|uniref:MFS transporter n=1 Tax=Gulosibacter molinativorax TaxID=256821 RepID=A0ABT7C9K7_9MICO|nr:MFS transporter [Gulosibacter molinativorax]MDJ1371474.1 MFS transporter [Gulosibacter molinativorax]QUY62414.1 Major Facilitator Superfamily protein [Gulosibacter molinativorax]
MSDPRDEPGKAAREDARHNFEALETGQIPIVKPKDQVEERIPAEIWMLLSATFFIAVGFGLVVPVLPQYAESFGVGATLVSVVVSAFAFMRLVTAPIAGPLVEKIGERTVYVLGLLIVAASSFATAFASDYLQLLVFRGLGGIGSAMFSIASSSMVVRFAPPSLRGRVSSLWGGMFLIGSISGPIFGGLLGQAGIQVPFLVYGSALLVAAAIVGIMLGRAGRKNGGAGNLSKRLPPLLLKDALAVPAYRASLSFGFSNGWANLGMRSAVVPLFVSQAINNEPWAAGAVVAANAVGNVAALQWSGRASDRIGRKPLIIAGLAVASAGMLALAFADNLWYVLAVSVIAGVGSGLCSPTQQAAIADIIGRERSGGRALSTFQMSQDVGQIFGPIVAGVIIDFVGYNWTFVLGAVILLIPVFFWIPAKDTLALGKKNSPPHS